MTSHHLVLTVAVIAQDVTKITTKVNTLETQLEALTGSAVGIAILIFLIFKGHKSPSLEALFQRILVYLGVAFAAGMVAGGIVNVAIDWGKSFVQ